MQITTPSLPGLTLQPLTTARPMVDAWTVGQLLQATVVAPVQPHRVTLLIGGSRMEAETNSPLRPGQQLTLRVEQRGETPLLRVLPQQSETREVQARGLRAALPRQTPLPPLLANLVLLARAPAQVGNDSAPAWAKLARALVRALPEPRTVTTPDGLRRAMNDSGTFFESRAARAAAGGCSFPVEDFKAGLLRLAGLLNRESALPSRTPSPSGSGVPRGSTSPASAPTSSASVATSSAGPPAASSTSTPRAPSTSPGPPVSAKDAPKPVIPANSTPERADAPAQSSAPPPRRGPPHPQHPVSASIASLGAPGKIAAELRGQLDGAISRVQIHQLNSLSAEEGAKPVWSMEIPVRRGEQVDVWSLRIEQDAGGAAGSPEKRWCVSLAFEIGLLGPVHARLTLQQQKVSASLWAEKESTAALIGSHVEELRQMLDEAGLGVGDVLCVHGQPARIPDMSVPAGLINVEA